MVMRCRGRYGLQVLGLESPAGSVLLPAPALSFHLMTSHGRRYAMTVNRTRTLLYRVARLLGDYQAVRTGRVGRRLARRAYGRATGRLARRIFR
jgi:hypothetical protein